MPGPTAAYALELNRSFNLELALSGLRAVPEPPATGRKLAGRIEPADSARKIQFLPAQVGLEVPSVEVVQAQFSVTLKGARAPNRLPVDCADLPVDAQPRTLAIAMSELVRTSLNGGEVAAYVSAGGNWRWAFEGSYNPNQLMTDFGALQVGNLGLSAGADVHIEPAPELRLGPRLHFAVLRAQGHSVLGLAESVH